MKVLITGGNGFIGRNLIPAYEKALNREDGVNTILVEYADFCKTK